MEKQALILDGKQVAKEIYSKILLCIKEKAPARKPKLAIVLIGDNVSSKIYIEQKVKACQKLGFDFLIHQEEKAESLATNDVVNIVERFNKDQTVTGIIVQMPLPVHIDKRVVINSVLPEKDVDGLNPFNIGQTFLGAEFEKLTPCTATGVVRMLEYYKLEVIGKKIVVIGSGIIAGKPIAAMLSNRRATVTVCNSKTPDLSEYTLNADMVISAVGSPALIKAKMIKTGAVVIDVGISRGLDGKIVGDAEFDELIGKVMAISPVPGGVGKLTVACLMENLLKASR